MADTNRLTHLIIITDDEGNTSHVIMQGGWSEQSIIDLVPEWEKMRKRYKHTSTRVFAFQAYLQSHFKEMAKPVAPTRIKV